MISLSSTGLAASCEDGAAWVAGPGAGVGGRATLIASVLPGRFAVRGAPGVCTTGGAISPPLGACGCAADCQHLQGRDSAAKSARQRTQPRHKTNSKPSARTKASAPTVGASKASSYGSLTGVRKQQSAWKVVLPSAMVNGGFRRRCRGNAGKAIPVMPVLPVAHLTDRDLGESMRKHNARSKHNVGLR